MNDKLFQLYTLAIMNYEKKLKDKVVKVEELYPFRWEGYISYEGRIKILSECIRDNKLIKDSELYKDYIIDVKE